MAEIMQEATDEVQDLQFIIALVYERCRVRLHEGKYPLIRARLGKRLRRLGFADLTDYVHFLRHEADETEITQVVDCLTTNYTRFLRETDHFDLLVQKLLPSLVGGDKRRFRIWSAACATGEEPYTLAFYLSEHFPPLTGWQWLITATDISTRALGVAQQGIYEEEKLASLPPAWTHRYFQKGQGRWDGFYRVKSAVVSRIQFQHLNLLGEYPPWEPCAVIFCRNVMIYFDRQTQEQLVNRLAQHLLPKGYLVIGHSESLTGLNTPLRQVQPTIYQRN